MLRAGWTKSAYKYGSQAETSVTPAARSWVGSLFLGGCSRGSELLSTPGVLGFMCAGGLVDRVTSSARVLAVHVRPRGARALTLTRPERRASFNCRISHTFIQQPLKVPALDPIFTAHVIAVVSDWILSLRTTTYLTCRLTVLRNMPTCPQRYSFHTTVTSLHSKSSRG